MIRATCTASFGDSAAEREHLPASMKRSLFIYRDELLDGSETFILSQGESLTAFRSIYLGTRRVPGLQLPEDRYVLLAAGRYRRLLAAGPALTVSELAHLRGLKPALVHAHFAMDAVNAMPLARSLGIPLIVTFHGWDATVRDSFFRRHSIALNRYVSRRLELARTAAKVLCVSEFVRRQVHAKNFSPDRTTVHYTGVDLQQFTPDPKVPREPIVLFAGRLVEEKGCEYLLRAMAAVQAKVKNVRLVVMGDGPLRKKLERHASATLRSVRFMGWCPPAVVREWMNKASVFCTPSVVSRIGDTECFGMVFAEAQAMGLPVASFAIGGIPEAVEHGVTGLLARERDTDVLAGNIVMLLTNAALWRSFSAAGQQRVKKLFDLEKQTAKLEEIYQEVLQQPNAGIAAS